MEKEKPYKCDVCHKRYKNLNGLKYHKTHSPPCNPELQQQRLQQQQLQQAQRNSSLASPLQQQPQHLSPAPSVSSIHPNNNLGAHMSSLNFGMMGGDQTMS